MSNFFGRAIILKIGSLPGLFYLQLRQNPFTLVKYFPSRNSQIREKQVQSVPLIANLNNGWQRLFTVILYIWYSVVEWDYTQLPTPINSHVIMADLDQFGHDDRASIIAALSTLLSSHQGSCVVLVEAAGRPLARFEVPSLYPENLNDPCKQDIFTILKDVGHRLTTTEILNELGRRGKDWSDSWVKAKLSEMTEDGLIDNSQKAKPKGYGMPEW